MRILITGARGQLGTEFRKILDKFGYNCQAFGKEELDITKFKDVFEAIKTYKPAVIINCSAYNQVDRAEQDFEIAYMVNALGVRNLALASREIGAFLVHYSTDYVFDGKKEGLYVEKDLPNPLSKYAISKLLGEYEIKSILEAKYLIFRVSWVYGEGKQNFLYKLFCWAQTQDYLKVACDEFSVPTSTRTIVEMTLKALKKGLSGLYHLVNCGYASRYEWAQEYFKLKGIKKFIYPAYQHEFNLSAKRPRWSAMSGEELSKHLDTEIKHWREALEEMVRYEYNNSNL